MLVYDDKLDQAEKLLNELYAIEPTNEEIFIQKPIFILKEMTMKKRSILKTALKYTEDYADVYNLIGMEYLLWITWNWQRELYQMSRRRL